MRYSVTNHDASIVFHEGDDLEAVKSAVSAHSLFYPVIFDFPDVPVWYVVWDNGKPVDMFFYGETEPEVEVPTKIQRKIFAVWGGTGRDALSVRDEE